MTVPLRVTASQTSVAHVALVSITVTARATATRAHTPVRCPGIRMFREKGKRPGRCNRTLFVLPGDCSVETAVMPYDFPFDDRAIYAVCRECRSVVRITAELP